MAIEFERNGKRWVLTAEHVNNNADNRDADSEDLALLGFATSEEVAKLLQLEDALRWSPTPLTVNFYDLDGFLEEMRDLGWRPEAEREARKVRAIERKAKAGKG